MENPFGGGDKSRTLETVTVSGRGAHKNMDTEKEKRAIAHLKAFEPKDGYYVAYSGGKDSDCIRVLAKLAGVKHELHHNLTTVDAPETVRYVKSIDGVIIDKRELSMFGLI